MRKEAIDIAQALWEITSVTGVPRVLYNPRADGKVERSVKTVKDTVNKLVHGATCY